ncbi:hypothetical protein AU476_14925 [Cupriavidus sp. UYMSc13B]|nr:hypothetical protein AU476_14925 [Cupriavidus sp. UYMSc13B]
MTREGLAQPNQQMGQRWPVGCVALEITQRCNLDCTLCYLSENSEAVRDIPLEEVMTRVEKIFLAFGRNTDVQVTGGEPTLRKRDELLAIVHRIHALGMRATLMTNGIRATRELLRDLAAAGLADVAFHVDTTQQRRGYQTEVELNTLRERYLERTAGLPLSVMFNTTVHDGNFEEIPAVVAFFRAHAGRIRTRPSSCRLTSAGACKVHVARQLPPQPPQPRLSAGRGRRSSFQPPLLDIRRAAAMRCAWRPTETSIRPGRFAPCGSPAGRHGWCAV